MNQLLPEQVLTFKSLDQVKSIRVYSKPAQKEGKEMSSTYMKMFAQGRICPRDPYIGEDGRKRVDVVMGELEKIKTYRPNQRVVAPKVYAAMKAGLLLTHLPSLVVGANGRGQRDKGAKAKYKTKHGEELKALSEWREARQEERREGAERVGNYTKELKERVEKRAAMGAKRKGVVDELKKYTDGANEHHNVFFTFKCVKYDDKGVVSERCEYPYTVKLSVPLIRALIRFATTRTSKKLKYQFGNDAEGRYASIQQFLKFVAAGTGKNKRQIAAANDDSRPAEKESKKVYLHTPLELRRGLEKFVKALDTYINPNSSVLEALEVEMSQSHQSFAPFNPINIADMPMADAAGRFFYCPRFLKNDIALVNFDDERINNFEANTGIALLPNSCLASCCLLIC